ncbi:MAG: Hypothetical protein BHV28_07910 [Candidatus Tokpelaia hoelldobleri]|uniref:Flagellar biosynthesis protein FliO n=1 Tax=Candidatus Tokpelaia hoelldobleri TaxID=1902579 RepID=A0A1U9JUG1_9HYPH|nr:MAG: Hypothetical protein BHV28_07910 [Candidatus Tokpelaia hoelldoblerii]
MYSWLSTQIGADAAQVVSYVIGLSALAFIAWLGVTFLRHRNKALFVVLGKNRPMRLSVRDAAAVDAQRRIVLVRRDDTEHLILIGGPSDVVIECNITPPDIEKRVAEKQKAVKAAPPVQPALLPHERPAEEQAVPAVIQARTVETGTDEPAPVPARKTPATKQPGANAGQNSAAPKQDTPLLEDEAEAMLLAIEQAVQDDFLLEAGDESHILPSAAQAPAPKAGTAHPASSVRQPAANARLHELQPRQQKAPAPQTARIPLSARTHTTASKAATSAPEKPAYSQPPALKPVSVASQTLQNTTTPTTHKTTPANLLPDQEAQPRPPLFVKLKSETVKAESRKPPEKKGQTDFKPFLPTDNKDFEKLIQEELLRTQINLKTPLPNKN